MPLITISENLGSGGLSIAQQVAEKLEVVLYDDDRLQKEAVELGIRAEDIKIGLDEKAPGFFDQILGRRPDIYMDFMEALVYEVSRRGDGIVIGHCSQMLLRDFGCALHGCRLRRSAMYQNRWRARWDRGRPRILFFERRERGRWRARAYG